MKANTPVPVPILYFSNELARGGAEEHLLQLLRRLDRGLFRPYLACTPAMAKQLKSDVPGDVEVHPLTLRKPSDLRGAMQLLNLIRRRGIGILHAHMFWASLHSAPVARFAGVPVVIETPHVREHWRKGPLKSKFFVDRAVGRLVDYYIAVSKANRDYLIAEKRLPACKVALIANGCDLDAFNSPAAYVIRKEDQGFQRNDRLLAVIARLEPQKGHRVLLEALPGAIRDIPNVRIVCVGEGSLRRELEAKAQTLGLQDYVRFVGFQNDVRPWLALAEATVLPSFFEGLPLAAIESLAAGKPVIASAVDGVPEIVIDGVTGLTFAPGDSRGLKEAICAYLRSPEFSQKMSYEGRRWVRENFNVHKQVQSTEELYLRAWSEARSRSKTTANAAKKEIAADRTAFEVRS